MYFGGYTSLLMLSDFKNSPPVGNTPTGAARPLLKRHGFLPQDGNLRCVDGNKPSEIPKTENAGITDAGGTCFS